MNFISLYKRKFLYKIKKKINIDSENNKSKKSLNDLFDFFGSDKGENWNNGKDQGHGYAKHYEKHFKNLKNKFLNILEIGSFSGASAASFVKYFSNARVFCIDINISNFKYSSKKIEVFGIDVKNQRMIDSFFKKINISKEERFFDIIIDDGSHKLTDILVSLNFFFKNLKKDGYYVIEDYNFLNYFKHLDNKNEIKIDELIQKIKKKENFESELLNKEIKKIFKNEEIIVDSYKGNMSASSIAFFKRLN